MLAIISLECKPREQKAKLVEAQKSLEALESPNGAVKIRHYLLVIPQLNRLWARIQMANTDERLAEVAALESRLGEIEQGACASYSCSPKRFQQLNEEIAFARAAIERWTDNIVIIRKGFVGCCHGRLNLVRTTQGISQKAGWESRKNKLIECLNCKLRVLATPKKAGPIDAV